MRLLTANQWVRRLVLCVGAAALQTTASAATIVLPDPLHLSEVIDIALRSRAEVAAANARAEALAQRPAIVSALEDPMVSPSIDHYPFDMMEEEGGGRRYDWSVTVEQRFPLSGVRGYRRAAAHADAQRAKALANGTELDLVLDAQRSYFMLLERRRMQRVLEEQLRLARQLVSASSSRYASGTGPQADVLRAEVEIARVQSAQQSLAAQIRAAEAMLNASLGRPAQDRVGIHHVPATQQLFGLGSLSLFDCMLSLAVGALPLLILELMKVLKRARWWRDSDATLVTGRTSNGIDSRSLCGHGHQRVAHAPCVPHSSLRRWVQSSVGGSSS